MCINTMFIIFLCCKQRSFIFHHQRLSGSDVGLNAFKNGYTTGLRISRVELYITTSCDTAAFDTADTRLQLDMISVKLLPSEISEGYSPPAHHAHHHPTSATCQANNLLLSRLEKKVGAEFRNLAILYFLIDLEINMLCTNSKIKRRWDAPLNADVR